MFTLKTAPLRGLPPLFPTLLRALGRGPDGPPRDASRGVEALPDHILRDIGLRGCDVRGVTPDRDAE